MDFSRPHLWLALAVDICLGIISFHWCDHWSHVPVNGSRPENTQVVLSRLDYPKQTKRWKVVGSGGGVLLEEGWELESVSGGRCRISLHTWRGINKSTVSAQGWDKRAMKDTKPAEACDRQTTVAIQLQILALPHSRHVNSCRKYYLLMFLNPFTYSIIVSILMFQDCWVILN